MTPEERRRDFALAVALRAHDEAMAMNRREGYEVFDRSAAPAAFIAALEAQDPSFTVAAAAQPDGELSNADDPENDVPTFEAAPLSGVHDETGQPDLDRDGPPFPAGVNRPDYRPFDADDLRSIVLALEAIPTWFPETLAKARAMSGQPDGEVITDAHGDELEHGGPGDFPGQFPDRTETPRETAAREKRDANP